jgi:hypothetical protein
LPHLLFQELPLQKVGQLRVLVLGGHLVDLQDGLENGKLKLIQLRKGEDLCGRGRCFVDVII